MTRLPPEEIRKVAELSRLELSEQEIAAYSDQLSAILAYADKLSELDTEGIEPTSHCVAMTNVFREDVPVPSLSPEEALANAPEAEADCFRVPQIIQG